jgi:hypothetical protein
MAKEIDSQCSKPEFSNLECLAFGNWDLEFGLFCRQL